MTWEGRILTHFLNPPFGGPSGATCAKRVPKLNQQVSQNCIFLEKENIDSGCYLLYFGHIDHSRADAVEQWEPWMVRAIAHMVLQDSSPLARAPLRGAPAITKSCKS